MLSRMNFLLFYHRALSDGGNIRRKFTPFTRLERMERIWLANRIVKWSNLQIAFSHIGAFGLTTVLCG